MCCCCCLGQKCASFHHLSLPTSISSHYILLKPQPIHIDIQCSSSAHVPLTLPLRPSLSEKPGSLTRHNVKSTVSGGSRVQLLAPQARLQWPRPLCLFPSLRSCDQLPAVAVTLRQQWTSLCVVRRRAETSSSFILGAVRRFKTVCHNSTHLWKIFTARLFVKAAVFFTRSFRISRLGLM